MSEYQVGQGAEQVLTAVFTFYDAEGNVLQETPVTLIPKEQEENGNQHA